MSGNQALDINPTTAGVDINTNGSDWLWAAFSVMLLSDLAMIAWGFTRARGQRIFHLLAVAILTVASIAYFSMASDLGSTPVLIEFFDGNHHQNYTDVPTRAIWYVRYIQWVITAPLVLLELLLATGIPVSDIFGALFMTVVAVVSALVGALVTTTYKWGYFAFAVGALAYIWFVLLGPARNAAGAIGTDVRSIYTRNAAYISFLLALYPIAWGLSEGGNVITSDGEMAFYGVLDILAGPVFLFLHLFSLRKVELGRLGMGNIAHTHRQLADEKVGAPAAPAV